MIWVPTVSDTIAFDGMAFDKNGHSRNMEIVRADDQEGIYIADFDLDQLRRYCESEVWGNAYRKPKAYSLMISKKISKPFIR